MLLKIYQIRPPTSFGLTLVGFLFAFGDSTSAGTTMITNGESFKCYLATLPSPVTSDEAGLAACTGRGFDHPGFDRAFRGRSLEAGGTAGRGEIKNASLAFRLNLISAHTQTQAGRIHAKHSGAVERTQAGFRG